MRLLVHALRKKNLPQGNLSNLLSSPTNQVCHRELTTQVCHSFIALFFIIKPVLAYRCRDLVDLGLAVSGWVWFAHLMLPRPSYHPLQASYHRILAFHPLQAGYHGILALFISSSCPFEIAHLWWFTLESCIHRH